MAAFTLDLTSPDDQKLTEEKFAAVLLKYFLNKLWVLIFCNWIRFKTNLTQRQEVVLKSDWVELNINGCYGFLIFLIKSSQITFFFVFS